MGDNMMTDSQRRAMIEFHRRMERAFRSVGQHEKAEAAARMRMDLEAASENQKGGR